MPEVIFSTNDPCEGEEFIFTNTSDINITVFNDDLAPSNSPNTPTWIYNNGTSVPPNASLPTWIFIPPDPPGVQVISLGQESEFISGYDNQHCSNDK